MATAVAPLIVSGVAALGGSVSLATATTIASIGLYAGTMAAQYFISQAMQPKEKTGTKLKFAFGDEVPQSIIIGWAETAGSLVYANAWAAKNAKLVQVFALADMPCTALDSRIWVDGEKMTIDFGATEQPEGFPVIQKRKNGKDFMWVKFKDGTQTTADNYLVNKFGGLAKNPWTNNHIGRGRCYAIVTTRYDKKEPTGIPQLRFVVRGIKLYDWTKDSTNGGTGTHRYGPSFADQNTHEYEDNAAIVAYNVARGIFYGTEHMYGGRGWPKHLLDNSSFTASRAASNDNVPLKGGGTQKRYVLGGEISVAAPAFDTLEEIKAASNGRFSESGGILYFDCGPYGAPEFVFGDGELFVNEAVDATIQPTINGMVNKIIASYTEPDIGGDTKNAPGKSKASYVTADDGQLLVANPQVRLCRDGKRAQRIALFMLNDNRRTLGRQVVMGAERRDGFRAGLVISWNSTRYGYSSKRWIIGEHTMYWNGAMLVELRELDPTDSTWTAATDEDDVIPGEWERIVPTAEVKPITVTAYAIKNNAGANVRPGLRVEWVNGDDDIDGKRVAIEVRLLDTTEVMTQKTVDSDQLFAVISEGIVKNEAYQVRAKLITDGDWRETDWTDWGDVTVYPGGADHVVAGNYSDSGPDETAPAPLPTPTMTLVTRRHRDGKIRQRLLLTVDLSGRPATESYRVRLADTTDSNVENFKTDEFPFPMEVQTAHSYTARILPVSRYGVVGPLSNPATGVTMPIGKKTTADGAVPAVTSLSIVTGHRRNDLEWTAVDTATFPDWSYTLIESDTTSAFSGVNYRSFKVKTNKFPDVRLGNNAARYYRATHYDTSDNPGVTSSAVNSVTTQIGDDLDDYKDGSILRTKIARDDLLIEKKVKIAGSKKETNSKVGSFEAIKGKQDYVISNPAGRSIWVNVSCKLSAYASGKDKYGVATMTASVSLKAGSQQWELGSVQTNKKGYDTKSVGKTVTIQGGQSVTITLTVSYSCTIPTTSGPVGTKKEASVHASGTITTQVMRVT